MKTTVWLFFFIYSVVTVAGKEELLWSCLFVFSKRLAYVYLPSSYLFVEWKPFLAYFFSVFVPAWTASSKLTRLNFVRSGKMTIHANFDCEKTRAWIYRGKGTWSWIHAPVTSRFHEIYHCCCSLMASVLYQAGISADTDCGHPSCYRGR